MAEPTIICPKCKNETKLTESLAAPLLESTRLDFEKRLAQKDLDVAGREKTIREREEALSKAKDSLESQVAERVQQERGKIAADEAKKAKLALTNDLNQKAREVADLQEIGLRRRGLSQGSGERGGGDESFHDKGSYPWGVRGAGAYHAGAGE